MKVIRPAPVTGGALVSSNVAETDHPAWSAATAYVTGARVIHVGTHRVYESAVDGNLGNDPSSGAVQWLDVGPTNRWAMFAAAAGPRTVRAGGIDVRIALPSAADAVGLVDIEAESVRLRVFDGAAAIYDRTLATAGTTVATFFDIPALVGRQIAVTATGAGQVAIGKLIAGAAIDLGETASAPSIAITDYSRRQTDDFGVTTVVERPWAKRISVKMRLDATMVDAVQRNLAEIRAAPVLWAGADGFDALTLYGTYKDFSVDVQMGTTSFCTLTIEGLPSVAGMLPAIDPAASGVSDLRVLRPVAIDDAALAASNVPEDDHSIWVPAAPYGAGAKVIRAHRRFESLIADNSGNDPLTGGGNWLDLGPTNRWAMFDQALGTVTARTGELVVTLSLAAPASALALLDVAGVSVRVQAPGYDQLRALDGIADSATFLDLPSVTDLTVTVMGASPAATVSVGTLLVGALEALGVTETNPTIGINDYSRKETDDFGNTSFVERAWAKRMSVRSWIASSAVDQQVRRMASLRASPALWLAGGDFDALTIYGFFRDFTAELGEVVSKCAFTIEGLSTAAPVKSGIGWSAIFDDNPAHPRPADGATVGAPEGTNVGNVPATEVAGAAGLVNDPLTGFARQVERIENILVNVEDLQTTYGSTASAAASAVAALNAKAAAEAAKLAAENAETASQGSASAAAGSASAAVSAADDAGGYASAANASMLSAENAATTATSQAGIATIQAVTATDKANQATTQATLSATYASDAGSRANDAQSSATAAAGSANIAGTQAGIAAQQAAAATEAASMATDERTLAALFSSQAGQLIRNPEFELGLAGWGGAWTPITSWRGAGLSSQFNARTDLQSDDFIPVDTSKTYRFRAQFWSSHSVETYIGLECYDQNKVSLGRVYASLTGNGGWNYSVPGTNNVQNYYSGDLIAAPAYTTGTTFIAGTRYVRPILMHNYTSVGPIGSDPVYAEVDYSTLGDVTSERAAHVQADIAGSQAATATAQAALAQTSATHAASVAIDALNPNARFHDWPGPNTLNNWHGWVLNGIVEKTVGPYPNSNALRMTNNAGADHGLLIEGVGSGEANIGLKRPAAGWYVVTAKVKLVSGSLRSAGVLLYTVNDGAGYIAEPGNMRFETHPDTNGEAVGLGVAGRVYTFTKLLYCSPDAVNNGNLRLYAMNSWSNFHAENTAKTLDWYECSIRPATETEVRDKTVVAPMEATVIQQAGAIATLQGENTAYLQAMGGIGGATNWFVTFKARSAYGEPPSGTIDLGADRLSLWNPSGSAWIAALTVAGGNAMFGGGLQAGTYIRQGTGGGWPVALAQQSYPCLDGAVISFGTTLANIPDLDFTTVGLDPLGTGETYQLYADGLSTTGFTARLKIITPGTTAPQTQTGATTPGTGPTMQMVKSNATISTFGQYSFTFGVQIPSVQPYNSEPVPGGGAQCDYGGSVTVGLYVKRSGVWTRVGGQSVSIQTSAFRASAPYQATISKSVTTTINLGADPIEAFGVAYESAAVQTSSGSGTAPATGSVYSFPKVDWSTSSSSTTRSATSSGTPVPITVRPK